MKRCLTLILLAMVVIGCSQNKPTPTAFTAPTTPVAAATATQQPSATALPASPTEAATQVSVATSTPASTNTSVPTDTPAATATNTRAPVTPRPRATATNTTVALKYGAPQLVEPHAGQSYQAGKDDLVFKWQPVADLAVNECYQITVQMVNVVDNRYGQFSQIVQETCNSTVNGGELKFTLNRPKFAPPNYAGMMADAQKFTQSSEFTVRWWVMVVRSDGTPLSPASTQFNFTLHD